MISHERLYTSAELAEVPREPGVYVWFFDEIPDGVPTGGCHVAEHGTALYVVNYESNTVSKVRTSDLAVGESVPTPSHPIGIAYEPTTNRVFVACYSGAILVFDA